VTKRHTTPSHLPDALREAVDRTVQATVGSAERSLDRTQGAIDDLVGLVRGAEERVTRSRRVVAEALDERRPATQEDVRDLKAELRRIGRRLDAIEERLPAKRSSSGAAPKAVRARPRRSPPRTD